MRYQVFVNGKCAFRSNSSKEIKIALAEIKRIANITPSFVRVLDGETLLMQSKFGKDF